LPLRQLHQVSALSPFLCGWAVSVCVSVCAGVCEQRALAHALSSLPLGLDWVLLFFFLIPAAAVMKKSGSANCLEPKRRRKETGSEKW